MADEASSHARGDEVVPRGDLRASHGDRDRAVEVLRDAAADGRITPEELDERVGAALVAHTYGELAALLSDLPATLGPPAPAPEAKPRDMVRIDCHSSSTRRDGPWMVPRRMVLKVTSGTVTLDFTGAVVSWPSLQIDADIRSGNLRLVTKPGILVSTDDVRMWSSNVKVRAPWGPEVPVNFRIDLSGEAHSSNITAGPRTVRRTFWQWLRRRPKPNALPPGRT
jgi:DUF1707 SHOCT-like domain